MFPIRLAALALLLPWPQARAQDALPPLPWPDPVPGRRELRGVLVARPVQPGGPAPADLAERRARAMDLLAALSLERHVSATDEYLVRVPSGRGEADLARELLASGGFEYVEPDWRVYPLACPDDPQLGSQWHHQPDRLDSCAGWEVSAGDPSVVVALCDTGVRTTHEDLWLLRVEGYNAVTQLMESLGGEIDPVHPHGTWVTGAAAATGDNGLGVSGVGQRLSHRMLRVSNDPDGSASVSTLTLAARTAANLGDRVVSVSYDGLSSQAVQTTGNYCRELGTLLVWAAGNDAEELSGPRDDGVIVVGASDSQDQLAGFSNFGSRIDVVAPGTGILTTAYQADDAYHMPSGTSFSAPLVAGLCGLMWSRRPELTPAEVEHYLRQGCEDLGDPGVDDQFGHGRIDVAASMALVDAHLPVDGSVPMAIVRFPEGRPDALRAAGDTRLLVALEDPLGQPLSLPARLVVTGTFEPWVGPLQPLGGGQYEVLFPPFPCGLEAGWYVEVDLPVGGHVRSPFGAPEVLHRTPSWDLEGFTDTIETIGGWDGGLPGDTATEGRWAWGDPYGSTAEPSEDHTPGGTQCWFTGVGVGGANAHDVDGGFTTLLSPPLATAHMEDPVVRYWRWYFNSPSPDEGDEVLRVSVQSSPNGYWHPVEVVGPTGPETAGGWFEHSFHLRDLTSATDQVRLRFVAEDSNGSLVEAAIDDLRVEDHACGGGLGTPFCLAIGNSVSPDGARISAEGSPSLSEADLLLRVTGAPDQPGLFFHGPEQVLLPLGNGFRCVGGQIVRLPVGVPQASVLEHPVDLALHGAGLAAMGTGYFQYWYRDPAGGGALFSLSDGLEIVFVP